MRMAMVAAGFTGGQAEELRRAMGFKRSQERMRAIEARAARGHGAATASPARRRTTSCVGITSFALYGFPESHAASFALLVYASAYLKAHHPAAFYAALLNNWPMGFYHPATLVKDAQRHGVELRPIDVTRSDWLCTIEEGAMRIGLRYVGGPASRRSARPSCARAASAPFASVADVAQRGGVSPAEMTTLASIGALNAVADGELTRRRALWQTSALGRSGNALFGGVSEGAERHAARRHDR